MLLRAVLLIECDKVEVRGVQHEFNPDKNHDCIFLYHDNGQTDAEQEGTEVDKIVIGECHTFDFKCDVTTAAPINAISRRMPATSKGRT